MLEEYDIETELMNQRPYSEVECEFYPAFDLYEYDDLMQVYLKAFDRFKIYFKLNDFALEGYDFETEELVEILIKDYSKNLDRVRGLYPELNFPN